MTFWRGPLGVWIGLDQEIVGVGLVLVSAGGFAYVHSHYEYRNSQKNQGNFRHF